MLTPFPDAGRIHISTALARELLTAAERLPLYDNRDFYSPALQTSVLEQIREANPDSFDELIGLIRERVGQWPYCALVRGLGFDGGNRLFVAINRAF